MYPQPMFSLRNKRKYLPDTPLIKTYGTVYYGLFALLLGVTGRLFVLRFYGPVNPTGSCRARSVYLTTRLLGRLSPLSG